MSDDLALLTGPEAGDLIAAAVGSAGGDLLQWQATQVDHRPGRSTTVAYDVTARWPDGERTEVVAAGIGHLSDADVSPGAVRLSDGVREVMVWRMPLDPDLPGLAAAMDPGAVGRLLARYGVDGVNADDITITVRAYRPRRRAVLEAVGGAARVFLKVVRPHVVEPMHQRHRIMAGAGFPSPRSLGWTDDGVLVLAPLSGEGMRSRMVAGGPMPTGDDLVALVHAIPEAVLDLPRRLSWTDGADHYARVVSAALPDASGRVHDLAATITAGTGQPKDEACHGDLYEAQLLLTGAQVTGVLDIDSAGPGRRADDLACLVGHAHILAEVYPAVRAHLDGLGEQWYAAARRAVDPTELDLRVAGVLLSLATGPHRVQQANWPEATLRRIDLVERWVERAQSR